MKFKCPVCKYPDLRVKPYEIWPPPPGIKMSPPYEEFLGRPSYEVCPKCGFEFGFDDNPGNGVPDSFEAYRDKWIADGSPWFSQPEKARSEQSEGLSRSKRADQGGGVARSDDFRTCWRELTTPVSAEHGFHPGSHAEMHPPRG